MQVNATESVEVIGTSTDGQLSSQLVAETGQPRETQDAGVVIGTGEGGSVIVTTPTLNIRDGARVSVSAGGTNSAGNLDVVAGSIRLENNGELSANTGGTRGNITLRSQDLILRQRSSITTDARGNAIGGNITIDTDVLAALENSDISANAQNNFGGRAIVNARGIFGTEFRDETTPNSDITASSERGREFAGTVQINTPDIDPASGLVELPTGLVDITDLIAQTCPAGSEDNESQFIVTGRGGLPPNPREIVRSATVGLTHLGSSIPPSEPSQNSASLPSSLTRFQNSNALVEATGWIRGSNGEIVLTENLLSPTFSNVRFAPIQCVRSD